MKAVRGGVFAAATWALIAGIFQLKTAYNAPECNPLVDPPCVAPPLPGVCLNCQRDAECRPIYDEGALCCYDGHWVTCGFYCGDNPC